MQNERIHMYLQDGNSNDEADKKDQDVRRTTISLEIRFWIPFYTLKFNVFRKIIISKCDMSILGFGKYTLLRS